MLTIIRDIFTTIIRMVEEKPLHNKDFMDKFSDPEDKKKLDEAVQSLKNSKETETTITLKNNEEITIVVK